MNFICLVHLVLGFSDIDKEVCQRNSNCLTGCHFCSRRHMFCPSLSLIYSGIDIPGDKPWVVSGYLLEDIMC